MFYPIKISFSLMSSLWTSWKCAEWMSYCLRNKELLAFFFWQRLVFFLLKIWDFVCDDVEKSVIFAVLSKWLSNACVQKIQKNDKEWSKIKFQSVSFQFDSFIVRMNIDMKWRHAEYVRINVWNIFVGHMSTQSFQIVLSFSSVLSHS